MVGVGDGPCALLALHLCSMASRFGVPPGLCVENVLIVRSVVRFTLRVPFCPVFFLAASIGRAVN